MIRTSTPGVQTRSRVGLADLMLGAACAAWTVLVVAIWAAVWVPPYAALTGRAIVWGVPLALLALALALRARLRRWPALEVAAGWAILVVAALWLAPRLTASTSSAVAIPAAAVTAWVAIHRPAVVAAVLAALTGAATSVTIYLGFEPTQLFQLLMVSSWAGLLAALVMRSRTTLIRPSVGVVLLIAYLGVTVLQALVVGNVPFEISVVRGPAMMFSLAALIALAGFTIGTRESIVRALVLVVAAVAGYALLRWITGPTPDEQEYLRTGRGFRFNTVGGELKVFGSFGAGAQMGVWMSVVAPFCVAAAFALRGRIWRALAILAGVGAMVALVGSQLRAGLVGIAAGVAVICVLVPFARALPPARIAWVAALAIVACGSAGYSVVAVSENNPETRERYQQILTPNEDPSIEGRRYKWASAVQDISRKPLGYGVGTAAAASAITGRFRTIASSYLESGYIYVAYEQGFAVMWLFVLALLGMLATLIATAVRARDRFSASIAIASAGALVSYAVVLLTLNLQEQRITALLAVMVGLGLAHSTRRAA